MHVGLALFVHYCFFIKRVMHEMSLGKEGLLRCAASEVFDVGSREHGTRNTKVGTRNTEPGGQFCPLEFPW